MRFCQNRHTISYAIFIQNRVDLAPRDTLTTVVILHFNHSCYTTHTIFSPKSGIQYRMPIFIQNRIDFAHGEGFREFEFHKLTCNPTSEEVAVS